MKMKQLLVLAGFGCALGLGTMLAIAQQQGGGFGGGGNGGGFGGGGGGGGFGGGRGNFDPAQMQAQMQEQIQSFFREQLEVKDDAEWKVVWEKVQAVTQAGQQVGGGGVNMGNLMRAAFRRNNNNNNNGQDNTNSQGGGRRRTTGMATAFGVNNADPDGDALQKVIDNSGSNAELKAAIAKYVDARKQKQAKLEQAQTDLRKILTTRQEAVCFTLGLL